MSNNFPKVSPDGRWIVFVQNRNGLLMRPDSKLYIVPFAGGKARLMNCNTSLMNSWHTFSPNGRWLAFSSKARSPYTQLMLTHIDANGNDTPAIIVDNTTAANRAVNIPEFVNVPPDGLEKIDPQATDFYPLLQSGLRFDGEQAVGEAIPLLSQALQQRSRLCRRALRPGYGVDRNRRGASKRVRSTARPALSIPATRDLVRPPRGLAGRKPEILPGAVANLAEVADNRSYRRRNRGQPRHGAVRKWPGAGGIRAPAESHRHGSRLPRSRTIISAGSWPRRATSMRRSPNCRQPSHFALASVEYRVNLGIRPGHAWRLRRQPCLSSEGRGAE